MERLWRTVKYEEVCLRGYGNATEGRRELERLLQVLQQPEAPPGPGLPDPVRDVPRGPERLRGIDQ